MQASISERLIGVELEFLLPIIGTGQNRDVQDLLATVMSNHGLPSVARSYSHEPLPSGYKFAAEHDSSLQDETRYQGLRWSKIEVKTAPMTFRELEQVLPEALAIINYFGARVNASCGFHVHHHFPECVERPEVVRNLLNLWWRFHPVVYGLVAPTRRRNSYCMPPRLDDVKEFQNCRSFPDVKSAINRRMARYSGLNLMNLVDGERMTVEWRLHQGTTDWQKIRAWVLATQRWVEHAVARSCHFREQPMANTRHGLNGLLLTTGFKSNSRIYRKVDKELRDVGRFLLKRWKHFNPGQEMKSCKQAPALQPVEV